MTNTLADAMENRDVRIHPVYILSYIESALDQLHERDIFHRVIQPENILLRKMGGRQK